MRERRHRPAERHLCDCRVLLQRLLRQLRCVVQYGLQVDRPSVTMRGVPCRRQEPRYNLEDYHELAGPTNGKPERRQRRVWPSVRSPLSQLVPGRLQLLPILCLCVVTIYTRGCEVHPKRPQGSGDVVSCFASGSHDGGVLTAAGLNTKIARRTIHEVAG